MRETWYVLEDGNVVDPSDCTADEKGLNLTHKSGVKVAMRGEVPHSRGVDVAPDGKKEAPAPADRELKPAKKPAAKKPASKKKPGYQTREA